MSIPTKIPKISEFLNVEEDREFLCKGYLYKITNNVLKIKYLNGWADCSQSETLWVYFNNKSIRYKNI